MRKCVLLLVSLLCLYLSVFAEVADTIGVNLNEIVIEGRTQQVVKYGVEYTPGKKMKKAAIDATSLLFNMQIPQLIVSPSDNAITTAAGAGISTFIDYVPASAQDLAALRPEDVAKIEVLDFPQDSRFAGADHVVNFIMQRYEWGGYTKITAIGRTLNDDFLSGNLYQKYVYKKWSFDASVSSWGMWLGKYRDSKQELFSNINVNGSDIDELTRSSYTNDFTGKKNAQLASARAIFQGSNYYIMHTISFDRDGMPVIWQRSVEEYDNPILPSTESTNQQKSQSISVALNGNYGFFLPRGNNLVVNWTFSHSGNNRDTKYALGSLSPIQNINKEKVYNPEVNLFYSKTFSHSNTLRANLNSYTTYYNTKYVGSYNGIQKLVSSENMAFLEYMQSWNFGLNIFTRIGLSHVLGRVNGVNVMNEINPRVGFQLQYQISQKNSVGLEAWWANSHPQPSTYNSALVRSNELLWIKGNPDLKNVYGPMLTASYNFMPTNNFSMFATAAYNRYANAPIYSYSVLSGYSGITRTYSDRNNSQEISAKVAANLRLFNNALSLYASGKILREINTGDHPLRNTSVTATAKVSYYMKNISASLYYDSPSKTIMNNGGFLRWLPCSYGLMATYSIGDLKVNLSFKNWFSNGHAKKSYLSEHYSVTEWEWLNGRSRNVELTLSYTFSYGKKMNHDSNLNNIAGSKSAILE
jgi:hypothetical protein